MTEMHSRAVFEKMRQLLITRGTLPIEMLVTGPSVDSDSALSQKPRPKPWRLLLYCTPVICLAVYYTPWLVSLGWHATHGMSLNYRGLRVRVPLGWTAVSTAAEDDFAENPQGVTLEKQPKTLAFNSDGPEMMYFNLLLPDPKVSMSQQIAEWQDLFLQAHPSSGFDVAAPAGVPSGIDCVQATPRNDRSAAALACVSPAGGWLAQFAGSQAHVPLFFEIAAALNPKR